MFELRSNVYKTCSALLLALKQRVECQLPFGAGLFGLLLEGLLGGEGLGQAIEVGLFQMGVLHLGGALALSGLGMGRRQSGGLQLGFKAGLALAQFGLLLKMGADLPGQWA